jgi:beta-lactam-binding protein with PASTA domain/predicted Ser/Thr protein kinase
VSVVESSVDGRYRIVTRIASGGMGDVYRAEDAVLGRVVALKLLHRHLAGDDGFVDRFRREARAAASLRHPNIVGVYDWGSTEETYFMVMEFVRGHNLRSLLTEFKRLQPAHVVEIGLGVLSALDHAHGQGIVHRDIKPENILIDADGTVKVADFGLARAFAESSISQAEGTVTGTVQYLGPEQVQGRPAEPRTDLYAFGVVLFELLTGRVPFTGETSMAIAYQHVSSRVPPPSTAIPSIPEALDRIVLHATEKDPAKRPDSARTALEDLARAGVFVPPAAEGVTELAARIPRSEFAVQERSPTVTIPRVESPRARMWRRARLVASIVILAAAVLAAGWATWVYAVPHYTDVPQLAGLTVQQATDRLERAGLHPRLGPQVFSPDLGVGRVVETRPPEGERLRTGGQVVLVTSRGPELFGIPSVEGDAEADAKEAILEAGFTLKVERHYDDRVAKGLVISQNPNAGQEVLQGSLVTVTVSLGPPLVEVPSVVGQPAATAQQAVGAADLVVTIVREYSVEVSEGSVIGTTPRGGQRVPKGSAVTLVVSLGPRTFDMPNVQGLATDQAVGQLEGLGLSVEVTVIPGTIGDVVVGQGPRPGETVEEGQQVTIYVLAR